METVDQPKSKSTVILNIRGQQITIKTSTLCQIPYFESILQRWNHSEEIHVDVCNRKLFEIFLDYVMIPKYLIPLKYLENVSVLCEYFNYPFDKVLLCPRIEFTKTIGELDKYFSVKETYPYHNVVFNGVTWDFNHDKWECTRYCTYCGKIMELIKHCYIFKTKQKIYPFSDIHNGNIYTGIKTLPNSYCCDKFKIIFDEEKFKSFVHDQKDNKKWWAENGTYMCELVRKAQIKFELMYKLIPIQK